MGKIAEKLRLNHLGKTGANPGCDTRPAYFSPSFMYHNGYYHACLRLYCRAGTNRYLRFTDVLELIPIITDNDIRVTMLVDERNLPDNVKRSTVRRTAMSQSMAIDNLREHGDKTDNDITNAIVQECEEQDYNDYLIAVDSANPVVLYTVRLIVEGWDRARVDETIKFINLQLARHHEGLTWDATVGGQQQAFTELMREVVVSKESDTSTGDNWAAFNFVASPGLNDATGVPIGVDVMSLTGSVSFMDFEGSLKNTALIASTSSSIPRYTDADSDLIIPPSSVFAQAIANHVCMRGCKAHHIVLNDFDYLMDGMFYRPVESKNIFRVLDVADVTINPLQGFGDVNDVVNVYARLTNKIVQIFNILEDLQLTQADKAIILTAVQQFYFNQGLWIANAATYPKRTRIVDITVPETYPTMGLLINDFTTLARAAARDNRELKADRIDTLFQILNQALMSHMNVLGRTTSIENVDALQTFYDFSRIQSTQMRQIQVLNLIDYIIWRAQPGDVVVLHGCDKLYLTTMQYLCGSLNAAYRKNVRVVISLDQITPMRSPVDEMVSPFNLKGTLYNDLDTDIDYSIFGRCLPEEIDRLEYAFNMPLSDTVRSQLVAKTPNQFLVHRARGGINNFIYANLVI